MKPHKTLLLASLILFLGFFTSRIYSYYFYDDFSAAQNAVWDYDYQYSRGLGDWSSWDTSPGSAGINGGVLQFDGDMFNTVYANELQGLFAILTNQEFSASPESPFGFEVTRSYSRLDPDGGSNPESGRMKSAFEIFLVENVQSDGVTFDNFVSFVEMCRPQLGTNDNDTSEADILPRSFWADTEAGTRNAAYDFTAATNLAGATDANFNDLMNWAYDDSWGAGLYDFEGNANANADNNNSVRFRVTTDGENAYFYVNPAPGAGTGTTTQDLYDGTTADFNDTFYLAQVVSIGFDENIQLMFGTADNRPDTDESDVDLDDFMIRTICDTLTASVSPNYLVEAQNATLEFTLTPTFSTANEAGIAEMSITLPSGYSWTAGMLSGLVVGWSTNGVMYTNFTVNSGTANPANNSVNYNVSGDTLKIRFDAAGADNNVFHEDNAALETASSIMVVVSNFTADVANGSAFAVSANNEKYTDTDWGKTATTGAQTAVADTYLRYGVEYDAMEINVVNGPIAVANIRPNVVYEGVQSTFFLDLSVLNTNNNADVSKIMIEVPDGFTIDETSIASERDADLSLSNDGSEDFIVVDYVASNSMLIAGSGVDTVSFNNILTTNFSGTNQVGVLWNSFSFSEVLAVDEWITNGTNELYPTHEVIVRKKPPSVEAYISPSVVANTYTSNTYTYYVVNAGDSGNNLEKVLIQMSDLITNVVDVNSVVPADCISYESNSSWWVEVNYGTQSTNVPAGYGDGISFVGYDTVPSLTNDLVNATFVSYADNGNGDGWVMSSERSSEDKWSLDFYTPPAVPRAKISSPNADEGAYTNASHHYVLWDLESAQTVQITLKNQGEKDNDIYSARILCPPELTNISGASSVAGGIINMTTDGTTNIIEVYYTNGGPLEAHDSIPANGDQDTIVFSVLDNINSSNAVSFQVFADNTSNYNTPATALENVNNLSLVFIPPTVSAESYISVPLDYIPTERDSYSNIVYSIQNNGRVSNIIRTAYIHLNPIITAVTVESNHFTLGGSSYDQPTGILTLTYSGDEFHGQTNDEIFLTFTDSLSAGTLSFEATCDIENDREVSNTIGIVGGKSQTVDIIPPPTRFSYNVSPAVMYNAKEVTNTNTIEISISNRGLGSNLLDRVRVTVPTEFLTKIVGISNAVTGLTNEAAGNVRLDGGYIYVDYVDESTNIQPGVVDTIFVDVLMDTESMFNTTWEVYAHNNSTNESGLTNGGWMLTNGITLASNIVTVIEPADAYITPNDVLTPATGTTFTVNVYNGTNFLVGRKIQKIRIGFPTYFTTLTYNSGFGTPAVSTESDTGIEYLVLENTGGLNPGSSTSISLDAVDTFTSGSGSVNVSFEVDYGDGMGWHNALVRESKSDEINFSNPAAIALSYAYPEEVSQDFPTNSYSFYVKNNGELNNNIRIVRIEAPSFITNFSDISSTMGATNFISNGNILYLYYTNVIESTEFDTISLIGWDNVEAPDEASGVWTVEVNNSDSDLNFVSPTIPSGKSFDLDVVQKDYMSTFAVSVTNGISGVGSTSVYSTLSTNIIQLTVYNQSGTGNNLMTARFDIPGITDADLANHVYVTNEMSFTNLVKSNATVTLSNGSIWVDYSGDPLIPSENDKILITVPENLVHEETNMTWNGQVAFDTTYLTFKDINVYPGKSASIAYIMPDPEVSVSVTPGELFADMSGFVLTYALENTGEGSSDIDQVSITIPSELQSGFTLNALSNTIATGTNYAAGVLTLSYSGSDFAPGVTDTFTLNVANGSAASTNLSLSATARNYLNSSAVSGSDSIFLASTPTFYVTPGTIDTSVSSMTNIKFAINNDINGDSAIQKVVLELPSEFDAILSTNSQILSDPGASVMGMITSLTLDYASDGNPVSVGDSDILTLELSDTFEMGFLTNTVRAYADFGTGFIEMNVKTGQSSELAFIMPNPSAQAISDPKPLTLYLGSEDSNTVSITIENTGSGSSRLTEAHVILPDEFENLSDLATSNGAAVSYDDGDKTISLTFSPYLEVGEKEEVSFLFDHAYLATTNAQIQVEVANITNTADFTLLTKAQHNTYMNVNVVYPPYSVEAYLYGEDTLYIIETNATLVYRMVNNSANTVLTQATISFASNVGAIFDALTPVSSNASSVSFDGNNLITVVYPESGGSSLGENDYDDIYIEFDYDLNDTMTIDLDTSVVLSRTDISLETNVNAFPARDNTSVLTITNANWGIVSGSVYPGLFSVNLKLYEPGTTTAALAEDGSILGSSSAIGTGGFSLTRVPAGTYDFAVLESDHFRSLTTNVTVQASEISMLSSLTLKNAVLDGGESSTIQTNFCWQDTNSYIIFPSGAVDEDERFSVDIYYVPFTGDQQDVIESTSAIVTPSSFSQLYAFQFDLNDYNNASLDGSPLELNSTLYLAYDESEWASAGWDESSLALYYWDDNGADQKWVRIGGQADTVSNQMLVDTAYLHEYYAVMAKSSGTDIGMIQNVTVRPKVFTPDQSSGYYNTVRISFELETPGDYEVKIYDLAGRLVRSFEDEASFSQGEVAWDGLDADGYDVDGGVYIYRVIAGDESYSGTVIIAR